MNNSLILSQEYCLFTFVSTFQALKAEKVLKEAGAEFLTIPTLREISAGCGLSIKIRPESLSAYSVILQKEPVEVEAIYHIRKQKGRSIITRIDNDPLARF